MALGGKVYSTHTVSGTLSVEDSQNLLLITTDMLQFHDTANNA